MSVYDGSTRTVLEAKKKRSSSGNYIVWQVRYEECGHLSSWRHHGVPKPGMSGYCMACAS